MNRKDIVKMSVGLVVVVLVIAGVQAVKADTFIPPKKIISNGIAELLQSNARQVSMAFNVKQNSTSGANGELNVNAEGIVERSVDNKYAYDGTLNFKNHKPGIDLNFSFLLRYLNNGAYLNIKETPGTQEIKDALSGKWLVLSQNEQTAIPVEEIATMLNGINNKLILNNVSIGGWEKIDGVQTRKYSLGINQDELKKEAESLSKNNQVSDISRNIGQRVAVIANNFNLNQLEVWITPNKHRIIRIYLAISPKDEKLKNSTVTLDLKMLPVLGTPKVIETPVDAQKLQDPTLLPALLSLGLK